MTLAHLLNIFIKKTTQTWTNRVMSSQRKWSGVGESRWRYACVCVCVCVCVFSVLLRGSPFSARWCFLCSLAKSMFTFLSLLSHDRDNRAGALQEDTGVLHRVPQAGGLPDGHAFLGTTMQSKTLYPHILPSSPLSCTWGSTCSGVLPWLPISVSDVFPNTFPACVTLSWHLLRDSN